MKPHHHKRRNFKYGQAQHIVLSASLSVFSSARIKQIIDSLLRKYSQYFGVTIYHRAIVGTHIHLILMARSDEGLSGFLRVISGQVAVKLRAIKFIPRNIKQLWKNRPWSRVLTWGRNFTTATRYVALNYLEGVGRLRRTHNRNELRQNTLLIDEILQKNLTKVVSSKPRPQLFLPFF